MAKKHPIKPKTREKVSAMLHMVQKELNADPSYPLYKVPKIYGLNTYYTQAMRSMKIIERDEKNNTNRMRILTITEKITDDLIRCANKLASTNARKYNLRKKEEKEAQEAIKRQNTPSVEQIKKEQEMYEEKKEVQLEEKKATTFEQMIYGTEAHNMADLKKQLKQANDLLIEAKGIIESRDEEIAKLKTYIQYRMTKEIDLVYELNK